MFLANSKLRELEGNKFGEKAAGKGNTYSYLGNGDGIIYEAGSILMCLVSVLNPSGLLSDCVHARLVTSGK